MAENENAAASEASENTETTENTEGAATETAPETTEAAPETPAEPEEISYHAVEKDGHVTAIWEMQGPKHLRTIDPRSAEGKHILSLFTSDHHEEESAAAKIAATTKPESPEGINFVIKSGKTASPFSNGNVAAIPEFATPALTYSAALYGA